MASPSRSASVLAAVLLLCGGAAAAAELEDAVAALGYTVRARLALAPTPWEQEQFQTLGKSGLSLRSKAPLADAPGYHPRFTLLEERYADAARAQARLARLREKPPQLTAEDDKAFPLRRGFAIGALVYVVSTDAAIFEPELERFTTKLQAALGVAPGP